METQEIAPEEVLQQLRAAISELPDDQRSVIHMFYQESLDILSIGRILNIPTGTVKSRLFKAREKLKKILKKKTIEL